MLTKIAITALILFAIWVICFRRPATGSRVERGDRPRALQLARCPGCGLYRLPGRPCGCPDGGREE